MPDLGHFLHYLSHVYNRSRTRGISRRNWLLVPIALYRPESSTEHSCITPPVLSRGSSSSSYLLYVVWAYSNKSKFVSTAAEGVRGVAVRDLNLTGPFLTSWATYISTQVAVCVATALVFVAIEVKSTRQIG